MTKDEVIQLAYKLNELFDDTDFIQLIKDSRIYMADIYLFKDLLVYYSTTLLSETEIND